MRPFTAALLATALAGCTQTASAPPAARTAVPEPASGPVGPGCGPQIARFREIIGYDLSVGRVARSVYDTAAPAIDRAETACGAGRSAEALALLRRTKNAAGYP